MHRSDYKYLIAYVGPLSAYLSLILLGPWSYAGVLLAFFIIPTLELFLPVDNSTRKGTPNKANIRFFDFLLYLNVPIVYGLIILYAYVVSSTSLSWFEIIGITASVGIFVGASGINVGHELGHRSAKFERIFAKLLLLPALYQHFIIEHNLGHHRNVATYEDPATARYKENIFAFWWRSVVGSYRNAWVIERRRLDNQNLAYLSLHNEMIRFTIFQFLYLFVILYVFGSEALWGVIAIAVIAFLLLECINYVEHYGLRRKKLPSGRYERVNKLHSWNSNHELGRIFLYELTRHADHHYKANKKYQTLEHIDESPQLPFGYPMAIIVSLVPPLWFYMMNRRIPKEQIALLQEH